MQKKVIVVQSVFYESQNCYYHELFLEKCLYK